MIETILLLAILAGFICLGVQIYLWRQDVLWGPYIRREERSGRLIG
ncbi:hypothetical protein [Tardiphaga alba]|nr:hypothetical protein [Tardiphaga alba]